MEVEVYPSEVSGCVAAPPSKSYSHRAVLTAAMASGVSTVRDPLMSEDVKASIRAAEALGAEVDVEGSGSIRVEGFAGSPETPDDVIDLGNSGTTLRFTVGLSSLVGGAAVLTGDSSLRGRPNGPLLDALGDLGSEAFSTQGDGTAPVVVRGGLVGGETSMEGSMSSQFFSSLLLAGQAGDEATEVRVEGKLSSRPYVDMTIEVIEEAGGSAEAVEGGFVAEPTELSSIGYRIPGDYSSASYPLALGAITGEVSVENLKPNSLQGDSAILGILEEMGAEVSRDGEVVTVRPGELKGVEVNCGETPDLVPTLAVLGALAGGSTEITGVGHLRHKETDRLAVMAEELGKMGADVEEGEDYLVVEGGGLRGSEELSSHGDHRVAMALTVAALNADGPSTIYGAECVDVSFPKFFQAVRGLGADIRMDG